MIFFLLICSSEALKMQIIPEYSTPPIERASSSAVYDEVENRLLTFGGDLIALGKYSSTLNSFDLENNMWSELTPESYFTPPELRSSKLFLRSDRILLVFYGSTFEDLSSEIYSYDLSSNVWTSVTLSGDYISARTEFTFASFNYSNSEYIAIYGGITKNEVSNELFL